MSLDSFLPMTCSTKNGEKHKSVKLDTKIQNHFAVVEKNNMAPLIFRSLTDHQKELCPKSMLLRLSLTDSKSALSDENLFGTFCDLQALNIRSLFTEY